jgi:cardiolipin synthase
MTVPNILTVLRMVMIPFFLMAIVYGHPRLGLWLFVVAGLTDAADGAIARFWNQRSELGAFLDPMADKLMLTAAFVALALPETGILMPVPIWLVVLVITRDVVIVLFSFLLNLTHSIKHFPPSLPGKVTTFMQIAYVSAVLVENAYSLPLWLVQGLMAGTTFFTVFSGFHYLWRIRRLREA